MSRHIAFLIAFTGFYFSAGYAVVGAEPPAGDEREIMGAGGDGLEIRWRISKAKLERVSQWNGKSEPPLSAGEAVAKARAYLQSNGEQSGDPVTHLILEHVSDMSPNCYIYLVEFNKTSQEVVVLLDGSVLTPVVTRKEKEKPAGSFPTPETLEFIKFAPQAYVFAVKTETAVRPKENELRLLNENARKDLVSLITNSANWYHGLMTVGIAPYGPGSVGFLFRNHKEELWLWFPGGEHVGYISVEGSFRGQELFNLFVPCAESDIEKWERRYAAPELGPNRALEPTAEPGE